MNKILTFKIQFNIYVLEIFCKAKKKKKNVLSIQKKRNENFKFSDEKY